MNSPIKFILCLSCILTGCSSPITKTQISKDEANAQMVREQAEQDKLTRKQALLEHEIKGIPAWVIAPPKADAQGFYGVGIGSDADLLTSMRKAKFQGAYELAKTINAELSAEDTMTGSGQGEYRYIVDLFVNRVNVAGMELIEQEVKPVNGLFKTYTLQKLSFADFNHVLKAQQASLQKKTLEDAYSRLMKRIAATPKANEDMPPKSTQVAQAKETNGAVSDQEKP